MKWVDEDEGRSNNGRPCLEFAICVSCSYIYVHLYGWIYPSVVPLLYPLFSSALFFYYYYCYCCCFSFIPKLTVFIITFSFVE
ncbi:hypothetical protein HanHA89_Chr03g0093521 [Helianthus annuus]|nr:hypothetical protein HanHA89_Chr03g0093521 [Helianthus annuus]